MGIDLSIMEFEQDTSEKMKSIGIVERLIEKRQDELRACEKQVEDTKKAIKELEELHTLLMNENTQMEEEETESESETPVLTEKKHFNQWRDLREKVEKPKIVLKQENPKIVVKQEKPAFRLVKKNTVKSETIKSQYIGVTGYSRNGVIRWRAKRGSMHLKYFPTEKEAAEQSDAFAKMIGNPNMKFNFPQ